MRLIDADALLDKIHNVDGMEVFENSNIFAMHYERMVKSMPTIEERKIGRWIKGKCSHCHCSRPFDEFGFWYDKANYCYHCGFKMEVDDADID